MSSFDWYILLGSGPVAQSVEQRIENPCVGGSIPPQATSIYAPQRPSGSWGFFASAVLLNRLLDVCKDGE